MALVDNAWYINGSTGVKVTDLGINSAAGGASNTITGVTVPAGSLIVVCISEQLTNTLGTVSDGGVNTYTSAAAQNWSGAVTGRSQILYAWNSVALNAASLVYTKNTSGRAASISAFYVTGIKTSGDPLDGAVTVTTSANTAAPSVTSGTPAAANTFFVGYMGANGGVPTASTTWPVPTAAAAISGLAVVGGHRNIGGSRAAIFNPTLNAAADTASLIVGFSPANATMVGWWNVDQWAQNTSYSVGQLVRQNATPAVGNERVYVCVVAGTSHATTEPTWTFTRGVKITDNTVTWQECTGIAALNGDAVNTPTWTITNTPPGGVKNTAVSLGQVIKRNNGASYQICTTAGSSGNAAEPSFSDTAGVTTTDNTVTWTSLGVVGNFTGWQAPHARVANAYASTWGQNGNSFYVASEHAETQSTSITWTPLVASLTYCVTKTNVPPTDTNITTGASVTTTGTTNIVINASFSTFLSVIQGISFVCGSGGAGQSILQVGSYIRWVNCSFSIANAFSNSVIQGNEGIWDNCTVTFGHVNQSMSFSNTFKWRNTPSAIGGSVFPTFLMVPSANVLIENVDLSALGSGKTIFNMGNTITRTLMVGCKLGASVAIVSNNTGTGTITLIRCDSAATNYAQFHNAGNGTLTQETTIVRTGGATDGVTPIAWKIVTNTQSRWVHPFDSLPLSVWNNTTGSPITLTVYGVWGTGVVPNNDEIWIEASYLDNASFPISSFINNTKANNLATGSALTGDSSTWGGSTTKFKMSVTFTPQMKGPIAVVVKAAKPNTTFYIDPKIEIS